jgi:hypothetical protein
LAKAYDEKNKEMQEKDRTAAIKEMEVEAKKTNLDLKVENLDKSSKEYDKCVEAYTKEPSDYNKMMLDKSKQKFQEDMEDIKNSSLFYSFESIYESYINYLSSLTPDKIVALFNIIMNGLIFSSFFSIFTIMLSEQIINKFTFLEKYPKILKLLRFRNYLNKKINKIYLIMHLLLIIISILGNIYIFLI